MNCTITISGQDQGCAVQWSKEISKEEALRLMARLEGIKRAERKPIIQLAPQASKGKPHPLQTSILTLATKEDISDYSLREIGRKCGGAYPQQVVHHINQLVLKGHLSPERKVLNPPQPL